MVSIFEKTLKPTLNTPIAITSIYGIGKKNSNKICNSIGISKFKKTNELTNSQIYNLRQSIKNNYIVSKDLEKQIETNIIRYVDIKSYRGLRHKYSYPVRGQRTHTNAKTQFRLSQKGAIQRNLSIKNILSNLNNKKLINEKKDSKKNKHKKN